MSVIAAYAFVIGFGLIAPIIVIANSLGRSADVGTSMVVSLSIASAVYQAWHARRWLRETVLQVDSDGITYHTLGLSIQTPWSNVQRIDAGLGTIHLWLHTPAAIYRSRGTAFRQATSLGGRHLDRRIPLSIFTIWSPASPIYHDIVRFAPHLINRSTPRR